MVLGKNRSDRFYNDSYVSLGHTYRLSKSYKTRRKSFSFSKYNFLLIFLATIFAIYRYLNSFNVISKAFILLGKKYLNRIIYIRRP